MNIINIEKKLNKIKSVLDVFKEDGRLSRIERDLLLGYIRDLYEEVTIMESDSIEAKAQASTSAELTHKKIEEPITILKPEITKPNSQKSIDETEVLKYEKVDIKTEHTIPQKSDLNLSESSSQEIKVSVEKSMQTPPISTKVSSKITDVPEELVELFADDDYTDLSDKLGMKKIDQISTSIGINERFHMINELFDGDGNLFNTMIEKLDNAGSLEAAKQIALFEIAIPMKWLENGKLGVGDEFIKLIRRKYK
jgi:hypothetical protein